MKLLIHSCFQKPVFTLYCHHNCTLQLGWHASSPLLHIITATFILLICQLFRIHPQSVPHAYTVIKRWRGEVVFKHTFRLWYYQAYKTSLKSKSYHILLWELSSMEFKCSVTTSRDKRSRYDYYCQNYVIPCLTAPFPAGRTHHLSCSHFYTLLGSLKCLYSCVILILVAYYDKCWALQ